MEELLSLKWNNHKLTFIHVLGILRDKELYTDATLACEGNLYSVHKLVLSTCSDYFSDILESIKCKNPVIVLKDIKHKDLEALLDYMYLGEVNVQQGDLTSLIKAAECLRIKGLAESDEKTSHQQSKHKDHSKKERRDSSFTPPAKRKKRDAESVSNILQHNGSDSFTNHHSGTQKPKRSSTPTRSQQTHHKEPITSHPNTDVVQEMFPQIIPKLEDTTNTACSTITNFVDPIVKEERDESDKDLDCYTLADDSMYKDEEEMIVSSIGRGHNNIENAFPSLLQQVEGEMLHNNSYEQTSLSDGSVTRLERGDDHDGSTYSFSVPRSARTDEGIAESAVGAEGRYSHFMSSDQAAGDGANAMFSRCLVCNKVFTGAKTKFRLERHMFTHTGQRPYQCLMCDYRAGLKEHLTRHIKSQHSLPK